MATTAKEVTNSDTFRIVCLCGSAGGYEAYRAILERMPSDTGMAFVIAAHRSIENTNMLPNLLSKRTSMPVVEVIDGTRLMANHVFISPPHMDMSTDGLVLHLAVCSKTDGWPNTISVFLASLARTCGSRSVAIILSGMGFDGASALQAIRDGGGMTFAQSDADRSSMPDAAVATGEIDWHLTAEDIGNHVSHLR